MKQRVNFLFVLLLFCQSIASSQPIAMPTVPRGAYTRYFGYAAAGLSGMPIGEPMPADAIIGIRPYLYFPSPLVSSDSIRGSNATGVFLYTDPLKDEVCMCTAGHTFEGVLGTQVVFDGYMKYRGKPFDADTRYNETISGYKSTITATIVARLYSSDADIALLLVPKTMLPISNFTSMGYSFDAVNQAGALYYTLHHTSGSPLRLADYLQYDPAHSANRSASQFVFTNFGNNAIGPGSSGAPLIYKGSTWQYVTGVLGGAAAPLNDETLIPQNELIEEDALRIASRRIRYARTIFATKISILENLIRKHCWPKGGDSSVLAQSGNYKKVAVVDNIEEWQQFQNNLTLDKIAQLNMMSSQSYKRNNPGWLFLKAATLNISCPVVADTNSKNIYGLATTIHLTDGFSYTATGDNTFQMNPVVVEPRSSAARSNFAAAKALNNTPLNNAPAVPPAGYKVKPNPSATGIFDITVPEATKKYSITVTALDGKLVDQKNIPAGGHIQVDISGSVHGQYVLNVYNDNNIVYTTLLVY